MKNIGKYLLIALFSGCSTNVQSLEKKCETVVEKIDEDNVKGILRDLQDLGNLCNNVDYSNLSINMGIELNDENVVKIKLTGYNKGEEYKTTARLEYTFCGAFYDNQKTKWAYQCFVGGRKVIPEVKLDLEKGEIFKFEDVEFKAPQIKSNVYFLPHVDIIIDNKTLSIGDVAKQAKK